MSEIEELGKRVLREAGFEVYVYAHNRGDLNDWKKDDRNFVRAVHNLNSEYFGRPDMASYRMYSISMIASNKKLIIPMLPGYELKFSEPDTRNTKNAVKLNTIRHDPRPVLYYLLGKTEEENYYSGRKDREFREVPRQGFLGKFGMTQSEEFEVPITKTKKLYTPVSIKTVLGTASFDEPAYLLQFIIDKPITEGSLSPRPANHPFISTVCGKGLAEDLISYVLYNPQEYYNLVRSFIPKSTFPNVNSKILSPPMTTNPSMDGKNYNGVELCHGYVTS